MKLNYLLSQWREKLAMVTMLLGCVPSTGSGQVKVTIDTNKRGAVINPLHYGIFYEEINHAGDGGLYAELIRNRSIEDNAANADFWWTVGNASATVCTAFPLNDNSPHCLKVEMRGRACGVRNEGWWGINVVKGRVYDLSVWVNGGDEVYDGDVRAQLQNAEGANLGEVTLEGPFAQGWQKRKVQLTATGSAEKGWLALMGSKAGTLYYDCVSLFPPTYKGRENGCRIDLAEKLEALHPAFMRFPGGCYIEGRSSNDHPGQNRFEWKKTIGPIEERPGHYNNNWFYACSDGLGFHELLQLSEDLGAEPMFVVNMGFGHDWEDDMANIGTYIQEALDAIEYCNGDVTTTWGAERARNGHPEPFNLRLLEIGNENYWFGSYSPRYKRFYDAIHERYPYIFFIANGGYQWNNPWPADVVDDHYYNSPAYFVAQYGMFDRHSRADYKLYIGEYAVTEEFGRTGNLHAALGEAVFMQGMENNSDVVLMNSYAPIFTNENNVCWAPDMIRFNSAQSYGTPSYWVQQMMANYHGAQNVPWTEEENGKTPYSIALSSWSTAVKYDNIRVTDIDGHVLYENDFSSDDLSDWTMDAVGRWSVEDGMLVQASTAMQGKLATLRGADFGRSYTVELDAVKTGGNEGFLIGFNVQDDRNFLWWNLGGWGNTQHAIEQTLEGTKTNRGGKRGTLTTGRTYHLKIEVRNGWVKTYIHGELINDKSFMPNERRLYFATNIDNEGQHLYVKVVNPYSTAQQTSVNLRGGRFGGNGVLHILTADAGTEENSMAAPMNVAPQDIELQASGQEFQYEVPAYSLCIFVFDVMDAGDSKIDTEVPRPLVSYSFERTDKRSDDIDGVSYAYTTSGNGTFVEDAEAGRCYFSGTTGVLSLGGAMTKAVLPQLKDEYTVSIRLKMQGLGNMDSYCWAWALAGGTANYMGLINSPGNNNWYYELTKSGAGKRLNSRSGIGFGAWHEVTVTYKDGTTSIFMDGDLRATTSDITVRPSAIAQSVTTAYIARSPFSGDKLMSNTYFDNFRIFNFALTPEQIKALADGTADVTTAIKEPATTQKSQQPAHGIYNLQGGVLQEEPDSGLFISNGRKFLKR